MPRDFLPLRTAMLTAGNIRNLYRFSQTVIFAAQKICGKGFLSLWQTLCWSRFGEYGSARLRLREIFLQFER